MTITICDVCDTEATTSWCDRHQRDECSECAKVCGANGTWAL